MASWAADEILTSTRLSTEAESHSSEQASLTTSQKFTLSILESRTAHPTLVPVNLGCGSILFSCSIYCYWRRIQLGANSELYVWLALLVLTFST